MALNQPRIYHSQIWSNTSTAQISNVKGYQYYLINGIQVAKFIKQFKITDISKTIEGQFLGGIGSEPIPFKYGLPIILQILLLNGLVN